MLYDRDLKVLNRLLEATREGSIVWREDDAGGYTAEVGGRRIYFRFRYFESTDQIGADPLMIELGMPGLNAGFFAGTEGYCLFLEILAEAFESWRYYRDNTHFALNFLDESLPERPRPE